MCCIHATSCSCVNIGNYKQHFFSAFTQNMSGVQPMKKNISLKDVHLHDTDFPERLKTLQSFLCTFFFSRIVLVFFLPFFILPVPSFYTVFLLSVLNTCTICVLLFQGKVFGLWCSCGMFCSEAPVQADPPPRLQSPVCFFARIPPGHLLFFTWCLFYLSARWLRLHLPAAGDPARSLHEGRPAPFPVRCFRASLKWGECAHSGHQEGC